MKVTFPVAKELKNIIASTVAFLNEATFVAKEDGLHLLTVDPSRVAVIGLHFGLNSFLEYEANNERFTINLEDLKKILSKAKAKDTIVFELDNNNNKLIVSIKGRTTKKFILPLIETVEGEELKTFPELDLPVFAELDAKTFKEIIESAKVISDEIKFLAKPEESMLSIIATGDVKEMRVDLTLNDEPVLSLVVPRKAIAHYGVGHLDKLTKMSNVTDTVILRYDSNKPLHLEFRLADRLKYAVLLAPREA